MTNKGKAVSIVVGIVVLIGISLAVSFGSHQTITASFRIVFGSVLLLFVPGYVWSFVFFSHRQDKTTEGHSLALDSIERVLLALALSMVLVSLSMFLLNLIGIRITIVSLVSDVAAIIIGGCLILRFRK